MRAGLAELTAGLNAALHSKFTESWDGNPKNSYNNFLTTEQKNAIIQNALDPLNILSDGLLNDNYGAVNSITAWIAAQNQEGQRQLLERVPVINTLQALKELAGPDVTGLYLSLNPQIQEALGQ